MEKGDNLLDHINKVNEIVDQPIYLEMPVKNKHVVMTSLENLPSSYKHLRLPLKTMSTKELTIEYITALLMHEMSKRKEKKLKGNKYFKAKGEIHLGVKMSRRATIVARRATLHLFATK